MDEDVAGLARVAGRNVYTTCAACGAPITRRRPAAARGPGDRDNRDLCPACCREVLRGETEAAGIGDDE